MKCDYLKEGVYTPKRSYGSLDDAIHIAKLRNAKPFQRLKLVGYKCPYCHKYHVGRGQSLISPREKTKFLRYEEDNFKTSIQRLCCK